MVPEAGWEDGAANKGPRGMPGSHAQESTGALAWELKAPPRRKSQSQGHGLSTPATPVSFRMPRVNPWSCNHVKVCSWWG